MMTARYATSSSVLWDGSQANRSSRALGEVPDARRERRREDPVGEHRHPDVDRQQRRVLERRDERLDLRRQRRRVQQQPSATPTGMNPIWRIG